MASPSGWSSKIPLGMILVGLVPLLPGSWLVLVAVGVPPATGLFRYVEIARETARQAAARREDGPRS